MLISPLEAEDKDDGSNWTYQGLVEKASQSISGFLLWFRVDSVFSTLFSRDRKYMRCWAREAARSRGDAQLPRIILEIMYDLI